MLDWIGLANKIIEWCEMLNHGKFGVVGSENPYSHQDGG